MKIEMKLLNHDFLQLLLLNYSQLTIISASVLSALLTQEY